MIEVFFSIQWDFLYVKYKNQNEGLEGEDPMIPCCHTPLNIAPELLLLKTLLFSLLYEELSGLTIMGKNNKVFEIMINNC